jgi:outer membrane receptor protein involved in Fe transport
MKNVLKFFSLSLLVASFALFAGSIFAQSATTGSIEGTVTDTSGAAVPGANIKVTSRNLISPQTATADDNGRYKIANLPPGKYSVTVESTKGFAKFEKSDVEVSLSRNSTVEVQLQPANVGASVTITDTSGAAVDVTANTTGTNVSTDQFSNLPTQRTVQSLYSIAPTVARSGLRDASGRDRDPSVAGSSGPENNYILDGVNTTDPAFGGSGANLPFEFVQEVEIKTGAYGAEYGRSTGGIFNVITKSGGNEFHGDGFGYFTTKGLVRDTKEFPFVGSAPNGFSEIDAGIDIGGPIKKDKIWFFGAFNPQQRKNYFLTQQFHAPVNNKITTPFYSGKVTWALSQNHTATFSTFGDFTKQEGFLFGGSGFGADPNSFQGEIQTGGHNYIGRLNSTFNPNFTGEFAFGLHFQRANTIPLPSLQSVPLVSDSFAVVGSSGAVLTPVNTTARLSAASNFIAFVDGRGGALQRNFIRQGFGLFSNQDRNRYEFSARLQNIYRNHTFKYGFEYGRNIYKINTISTGVPTTFPDTVVNADGSIGVTHGSGNNQMIGFRTTNNFGVCTVQGTNIACPASALTSRVQALITAGLTPAGITSTSTASLTAAQLGVNPFLVLSSVRVRDFRLIAPSTNTNMEAFYIQDDYKLTKNIQLNGGVRWDYQQAYGSGNFSYLKLDNFIDNFAPRAGVIWDFTGKGKGKVFLNWARYIETPLPLDINVRAGSDTTQTDKNINVSTLNSPASAYVVSDIGNLGSTHTPIDAGLKPQDVAEATGGFEYEIAKDLAVGVRGIYRYQRTVIEDGSFDDGENYFLFNPGRRGKGVTTTTEDSACLGINGSPSAQCFGPARRYYRALEFTATKRFTNNYQFIASYVYSSLIGNYEGLFRNDNGQSDPNITSLFDLVSLLNGTYGRLPNDRPHQFKFDGSYRTPWKLLIGASFRAQSGIPFNALIPHPVYGNNEGFGVPRGTAIVPTVAAAQPGFPNEVDSIGSNRTPTTFNLDMNAYYPVKLGEKRELRFQADWFNVFNNQRAIRLDETLSINSGIPGVANIPANRFPNPFYGAGTIFQFPSSLRLGVKFQF